MSNASIMNSMYRTKEFKAIYDFYKNKVASRSGVPFINHIIEGMRILVLKEAYTASIQAYMVHPLFQMDEDLMDQGVDLCMDSGISPYTVLLAMEYRQRANSWLSDKVKTKWRRLGGRIEVCGRPDAGSMPEVKEMLIADKVQNRKDFEIYHLGKHKRSKELSIYFQVWLSCLSVSEKEYQELIEKIKQPFDGEIPYFEESTL